MSTTHLACNFRSLFQDIRIQLRCPNYRNIGLYFGGVGVMGVTPPEGTVMFFGIGWFCVVRWKKAFWKSLLEIILREKKLPNTSPWKINFKIPINQKNRKSPKHLYFHCREKWGLYFGIHTCVHWLIYVQKHIKHQSSNSEDNHFACTKSFI